MNLREIINQLEFCEFVDGEGHALENNMAWTALQKMAGLSTGPDPVYYGFECKLCGVSSTIASLDASTKEVCFCGKTMTSYVTEDVVNAPSVLGALLMATSDSEPTGVARLKGGFLFLL